MQKLSSILATSSKILRKVAELIVQKPLHVFSILPSVTFGILFLILSNVKLVVDVFQNMTKKTYVREFYVDIILVLIFFPSNDA